AAAAGSAALAWQRARPAAGRNCSSCLMLHAPSAAEPFQCHLKLNFKAEDQKGGAPAMRRRVTGIQRARRATMPPSPRLSARSKRIAYLREMMKSSDQSMSDSTPRIEVGAG